MYAIKNKYGDAQTTPCVDKTLAWSEFLTKQGYAAWSGRSRNLGKLRRDGFSCEWVPAYTKPVYEEHMAKTKDIAQVEFTYVVNLKKTIELNLAFAEKLHEELGSQGMDGYSTTYEGVLKALISALSDN
jgi:hypothetical protein